MSAEKSISLRSRPEPISLFLIRRVRAGELEIQCRRQLRQPDGVGGASPDR